MTNSTFGVGFALRSPSGQATIIRPEDHHVAVQPDALSGRLFLRAGFVARGSTPPALASRPVRGSLRLPLPHL